LLPSNTTLLEEETCAEIAQVQFNKEYQ